jgi:hypothetical protein
MRAFLHQELVVTRTPTLPLNDRSMWRRLLSRAHPDAGGSHELFIWTEAIRGVVCSSQARVGVSRDPDDQPFEQRAASDVDATDRIPFDEFSDFEVLTDRAVTMADAVAEPYGYLLRQVADCYPVEDGPLYDQQRRGASYKSLAAIGHRVGMTKPERVQWYRITKAIPLSQRHAGHILSQLKRRAA